MPQILHDFLSDFKWYRKWRKGKWRYVRVSGHFVYYWIDREPLYNEVVIKEEEY